MKRFAIILLGVWWFGLQLANAQIDVTETIFSKMDIVPQHELWDGNQTMLMGFTSLLGDQIDIPGPTLVYTEGDSVELQLWNMSQGASHTIHLHGLDVDQQNDGVPHLSFEVGHSEIRPYYFKVPHPGTYLYHCHVTSTLHVQSGMYGLLIVKPQGGESITWDGGYDFHKEYAWMTSEIDTVWHTDSIINMPHDTTTNEFLLPEYDPQYFLVNGRSETQLAEETIQVGAAVNEVVLLRLANIGFYGNNFSFPPELNATIISSDGRPLPNEEVSDSLTILPGERYQILLYPENEIMDSIAISYFNLNTQTIINTQQVAVQVTGYFEVDEPEVERINVYPNPVKDQLQIGEIDAEQLEVFCINGQQVLSVSNRPVLDVSHLPNGTYVLRAGNRSFTFLKK